MLAIGMTPKKSEQLSMIERAAFSTTRWIGSIRSIVVHTVVFVSSFVAVYAHVVPLDSMLLIVTTAVSLEAIYLAIFIQMSVTRTTESLEEVEQDIDEIQEDVDEIQDDVDELQEDVEEMTEAEKKEALRRGKEATLDEIHRDLRKLVADVERLQKQS